MKKKKYLQTFLDKSLLKQTQLFFGEKSYIKINNITEVRSSNSFMINVCLYIEDPSFIDKLYPDGLNLLVRTAWDSMGTKKSITISSSFDLIPEP